MPEPSYDFFATGRPAAQPEAAPQPIPGGHAQPASPFGGAAPQTNQFGTPTAPVTAAPPEAQAFPVAAGSGYSPGSVNQFGTPLDVIAAPTGPFAAPGIAAGPISEPGMVSTWGGPVPHGHAASAHAAPAGEERPGAVLAAGVLSILTGAWGVLSSITGLAALAALTSAFEGSAGGAVSVVPLVQAVLAFTLVLGVVWLALGIGAVRGSRTSVRWLRIVVIVSAALALYSLVTSPGLVDAVDVAWHGAVLWLLYSQPTTLWMRRPS